MLICTCICKCRYDTHMHAITCVYIYNISLSLSLSLSLSVSVCTCICVCMCTGVLYYVRVDRQARVRQKKRERLFLTLRSQNRPLVPCAAEATCRIAARPSKGCERSLTSPRLNSQLEKKLQSQVGICTTGLARKISRSVSF